MKLRYLAIILLACPLMGQQKVVDGSDCGPSKFVVMSDTSVNEPTRMWRRLIVNHRRYTCTWEDGHFKGCIDVDDPGWLYIYQGRNYAREQWEQDERSMAQFYPPLKDLHPGKVGKP